jgi:hypothetical protein
MSTKPELANRAQARATYTPLFIAAGLFAVLGAVVIIPVRGVR